VLKCVASVSTEEASTGSLISDRPSCRGITVSPSGRFPSCLSGPYRNSLTADISATRTAGLPCYRAYCYTNNANRNAEADIKQHVFVQLPTSADSVALLAIAVASRLLLARRPCCKRSISPGRRDHSCKPITAECGCRVGQTDRRTDRGMDGRTPDRCIDPAPHTMRAVSKSVKLHLNTTNNIHICLPTMHLIFKCSHTAVLWYYT